MCITNQLKFILLFIIVNIINYYFLKLLLFSYNFMNKDEAGRVIRFCKEKNVGTVAMKTSPGIESPFGEDSGLEPLDPRCVLVWDHAVQWTNLHAAGAMRLLCRNLSSQL